MDEDTNMLLFESLRGVVSLPTMEAIESFGFGTMTEIQALSLPPLLKGKDLRGTAKTGSGKTLAFLIPAIECLNKLGFQQAEGTGVLVLSPTRELAMQIHTVAQQFLRVYNENRQGGCNLLTCGVLTGGADRTQEKRLLKKGSCILIATPGRLLDHLHNTETFHLKALKCLVLDEADKMLDKHFEEAMMSILNILPKERQTMLFSATKTPQTNELVAVALKENFVDVDASAKKGSVTVNTLKQAYVVCPTEKKFLFLYNIIKSFEKQRKMMVFFSSCDAVKFYYELLTYVQVNVLCIHGKQEQAQRTKSFNEFTSAPSATLLCTDVAARGWDIPEVDYVLQYDPPHDPSEYIHRVGRTARADRSGEALLLLRQEELPFVRCLEKRRAILTEQVLNVANLPDEQKKVESLVQGTPFLRWWAKKAWKASIHSYTLHKRKDIFNIYNLDIKKLGKSFGFSEPPKVDLAIEYKKSGEKKLLKRIREGYYDDAYERSNKEATFEDTQCFNGNGVADCVKENEDGYPVNTVEDGRNKKKNESKKRSVDEEDDGLKETEETEHNRNKKMKKYGKRSVSDEDDVLKGTEEIKQNGNQKKKKSKKRFVDDEDDVLTETEKIEQNGNQKKKKSKKRFVDDEDDVLKETEEIEQNGNKNKNKYKKRSVDDEDDVLKETEETEQNRNEKIKKSKKRSVDDEDILKETEETEQNRNKKMKKSKKRPVDNEGDVFEETKQVSSHKKKHKRRKNVQTLCER